MLVLDGHVKGHTIGHMCWDPTKGQLVDCFNACSAYERRAAPACQLIHDADISGRTEESCSEIIRLGPSRWMYDDAMDDGSVAGCQAFSAGQNLVDSRLRKLG